MSSGGAVGFAIILLGAVMGVVLAQPNMDRAIEDLREARTCISKEILALKGTDFGVTAVHNNTTKELEITIDNTGSETIPKKDLDLIVDGTVTRSAAMTGGILYPGEEVVISIKNATRPSSIRIIGPYGISACADTIVYR